VKSRKLFEVMDTITKTNHGDIEFIVVANSKWFNSLSDKHKEIIMNSALIAEKDVRDKVSAIEADAYALAESKGMKIVTPSKADIDAFKKASKPVYDAYKNNAGKLGEQLLEAASKL
jgi:C4-dicarboxylate-binding protein DctP